MRRIINEKNLKNKKILLRLDLNVPLNKGKITDTTRVDKILPTLNFLIKERAKIIILSHIGRPRGKIVKELSLEPIREELQKKLYTSVKLLTENIKEIKNKNYFDKYNEEILILENIRFYSEEEKNDTNFAKHLSSLGDIFVNDAFSCSHRAHASIHQIPKFLPSFSGLQLDLEFDALRKITSEIIRPITCIIGGSKISTKINVIKKPDEFDDNSEIIDLLKERMQLGIKKYGHGVRVNQNTQDFGTSEDDWELMALEEMLDGLIYTTASIIRYRRKKSDD